MIITPSTYVRAAFQRNAVEVELCTEQRAQSLCRNKMYYFQTQSTEQRGLSQYKEQQNQFLCKESEAHFYTQPNELNMKSRVTKLAQPCIHPSPNQPPSTLPNILYEHTQKKQSQRRVPVSPSLAWPTQRSNKNRPSSHTCWQCAMCNAQCAICCSNNDIIHKRSLYRMSFPLPASKHQP